MRAQGYIIKPGMRGDLEDSEIREEDKVIMKETDYGQLGQGIPYHTIREVSILRELNHPNVIRLIHMDHKVSSATLVYEFLPRDLRTVLEEKFLLREDKQLKYVPGAAVEDLQIKDYYRQVLDGVGFLHSRCILHRDLKPTDLRISVDNMVKISNFRLSRKFTPPLRTYTHEVVTLWYRPPEILLGQRQYDTSIDMWSAGCILAEVHSGDALFRGDSEIDQLYHIFKLLGTPTKRGWPGLASLPDYQCTFPSWDPVPFQDAIPNLTDSAADLLRSLLVYHSPRRMSAAAARAHPFFDDLAGWRRPSRRPAACELAAE